MLNLKFCILSKLEFREPLLSVFKNVEFSVFKNAEFSRGRCYQTLTPAVCVTIATQNVVQNDQERHVNKRGIQVQRLMAGLIRHTAMSQQCIMLLGIVAS